MASDDSLFVLEEAEQLRPLALSLESPPRGLVFDPASEALYLAIEHALYEYDPSNEKLSRFAREKAGFRDGPVGEAEFNRVTGLALSSQGRLIIADYGNNRIRQIDISSLQVSTLAGSGLNFDEGMRLGGIVGKVWGDRPICKEERLLVATSLCCGGEGLGMARQRGPRLPPGRTIEVTGKTTPRSPSLSHNGDYLSFSAGGTYVFDTRDAHVVATLKGGSGGFLSGDSFFVSSLFKVDFYEKGEWTNPGKTIWIKPKDANPLVGPYATALLRSG